MSWRFTGKQQSHSKGFQHKKIDRKCLSLVIFQPNKICQTKHLLITLICCLKHGFLIVIKIEMQKNIMNNKLVVNIKAQVKVALCYTMFEEILFV